MDIEISFHQMESSETLKSYCSDKLNKMTKYYGRIESVRVVMEVIKLDHHVSATVHLPQKVTLRADVSKRDMYEAIDAMMDKLERQLTDYKEKH